MFFLPFDLRRNPVCLDRSNAGDSVVDIRQQSRVDAVQSVHVFGQCLGDVPQTLRFLDLYVGHVRKVLIVSDGRAFWGWTLSALV